MEDYISSADLDKLEARLHSFSNKVHNHIMREAAKVAATIIAESLKREVPRKTGRLKESITYKIKKTPGMHEYKATVGAPKSEAFKLRFLETGTSAHLIKQPKLKREIHHPGSSRYKGIVTKTFLATAKIAANSARDYITNAIRSMP